MTNWAGFGRRGAAPSRARARIARSVAKALGGAGLLLSAGLLLGVTTPSPAEARAIEVDDRACAEEARRIFKLDYTCVLSFRLTEEGAQEIPETFRPLLAGATCDVPLDFVKADVYGVWITDGLIDPAPIDVDCRLSEAAGGIELRARFDARCDRVAAANSPQEGATGEGAPEEGATGEGASGATAGEPTGEPTGFARPEWRCSPGMSLVSDFGFVGGLLVAYVNAASGLSEAMSRLAAELDGVPPLNSSAD